VVRCERRRLSSGECLVAVEVTALAEQTSGG
jgi:hypothetical protein